MNNKSNNIGNSITTTKNPLADNFDSFAFKLRMKKFDINQIMQFKNEAISNERNKNKRKKATINIQKIFRGHQIRKKFKKVMDEINKNIIIEYFREKRRDKIQKNYKEIILRNLDKYIDRKRDIKRIILKEYFDYCATMIKKTYIGYKIRNKYIPEILYNREKKEIIMGAINSYKTRLILKTLKIQDILIEIANIQNCLSTLNPEERNSDKTDKLKREFNKRLPNLLIKFIEEFYKLKNSRHWVNYSRTSNCWMDKFFKIMTTDVVKNIFIENPNILSQSITEMNMNSSKFIPNLNKQNFKDSKSIKIKNNIKESQLNFSTEGKVVNDINESNIINTSPNQNLNLNNTSYINDVNLPTSTFSDHDNKPIKVNPKKMYDLSKIKEFTSEDNPYLDYKGDVETQNINIPTGSKKKTNMAIKRKQPKYDARKAIEEASIKNNENQNEINPYAKNKINEREAFRNFLKEMKEGEAKAKANKEIDVDNNTKNNLNNKDKEGNKKNPINKKESKINEKTNIKSLRGSSSGGGNLINNIITNSNSKDQTKEDEDTFRRKKVVTTEINLRRKLHELEKSPQPMIDVKKIKSKIDCWGSENDNANIKKYKRIDDFNTEKKLEPKNNFFASIEQDINSIDNGINLNDLLRTKINKMKDYPYIPYIKSDSFYIKHYSNEIYDQLLLHLNKHYEEMKN